MTQAPVVFASSPSLCEPYLKNQDFDNNSRAGLYIAVKRVKLRIFELFFSIVGIC
tara:strand:- start:48 stop:212 length:165 start_codon:yes stop_codon:yes gene_type:complete